MIWKVYIIALMVLQCMALGVAISRHGAPVNAKTVSVWPSITGLCIVAPIFYKAATAIWK